MKAMKKLKDRRGEGYIDVAIAVLVISFLLALSVGVLNVMMLRSELGMMSRELADIACASGGVGDAVWERLEELQEECGIRPTVEFQATYFDAAAGSVQLGDSITCILTLQGSLPGFGEGSFPFTLKESASGLSRVYWK